MYICVIHLFAPLARFKVPGVWLGECSQWIIINQGNLYRRSRLSKNTRLVDWGDLVWLNSFNHNTIEESRVLYWVKNKYCKDRWTKRCVAYYWMTSHSDHNVSELWMSEGGGGSSVIYRRCAAKKNNNRYACMQRLFFIQDNQKKNFFIIRLIRET